MHEWIAMMGTSDGIALAGSVERCDPREVGPYPGRIALIRCDAREVGPYPGRIALIRCDTREVGPYPGRIALIRCDARPTGSTVPEPKTSPSVG